MKFWRKTAAALGLIALLAAGLFFGREAVVSAWLGHRLASALAAATGGNIELREVSWRDGVLRIGQAEWSGGPRMPGPWRATDLRASVGWPQLFDPLDQPLEIAIAEAEVVWPSDGEPGTGPAVSADRETALPPIDLLVGKCRLRFVDQKGWTIDGSQVRAVQKEGTWSLAAKGGSLALEGRPALQIERLTADNTNGAWTIGSFALKDSGNGVVAGSASHTSGVWSAEFSWQDLDLATLLTPEFAGHLGGQAAGDAVFKDGTLSGQMKIEGGESQAIGLFAKLASLIDKEEWNRIPWQIFRCKFIRRADGRTEFSDLQALSPKGLAVRGGGFYSLQSVGADLQVGVRAAGRPILGAFVPVLFSHERDGYYWTQVKIGGTPEAPTENLGARLAAAIALAPAAGAAQSAVEIPAAASEAVGGLLRGIMGR